MFRIIPVALLFASLAVSAQQLISQTSSGEPANSAANVIVSTPDGRFTLFHSAADNLAGATAGEINTFVYDSRDGSLSRIGDRFFGISISDDGRRIAGKSGERLQVFERISGELLVELPSPDEYPVQRPILSGNGGSVVFYTGQVFLAQSYQVSYGSLFHLNIDTGVLTEIADLSADKDTFPQTSLRAQFHYPDFDGNHVLFDTRGAPAGAALDSNGLRDVYLFDVASGSSTLISRDSTSGFAPTGRASHAVGLGGDGKLAWLVSDLPDLGEPGAAAAQGLYRWERNSGAITRISPATSQVRLPRYGLGPQIVSSDANAGVFILPMGTRNGRFDAVRFVPDDLRDMREPWPVGGERQVKLLALSPDSRFTVFNLQEFQNDRLLAETLVAWNRQSGRRATVTRLTSDDCGVSRIHADNSGVVYSHDCTSTGTSQAFRRELEGLFSDNSPAIRFQFEEPASSLTYTGIGNLRGWAISEAAEITSVELFIDGVRFGNIPYGGARGDVGTKFPQVPGSFDSGFSLAFGYSNLEAGSHSATVVIRDGAGNEVTRTHSFLVERFTEPFIPADALISTETLSGVLTQGERITLEGVTIHGQLYDLTLAWRTATQGFEIVEIRGSGRGFIAR